MSRTLRLLAFGAHPDDCDVKVGGLAIKYARAGHQVKFVSVTNGDTGHHLIGGAPLAQRRCAEAQRAAQVAGIEYQVLDIHNGQLLPTLENRWLLVRLIREFNPDLVLTHRPNDYHPDHRYTSQLVQDAAYTVTVPGVAALTPYLSRNPVIAYVSDHFQKPYPFSPDVVVSIDDVWEKKLDMLDCHVSQFYEFLPHNSGTSDQVPDDPVLRRRWLGEQRGAQAARVANQYREVLARLYGAERGARVQRAEAFEICEYGAPLPADRIPELFPFFG